MTARVAVALALLLTTLGACAPRSAEHASFGFDGVTILVDQETAPGRGEVILEIRNDTNAPAEVALVRLGPSAELPRTAAEAFEVGEFVGGPEALDARYSEAIGFLSRFVIDAATYHTYLHRGRYAVVVAGPAPDQGAVLAFDVP